MAAGGEDEGLARIGQRVRDRPALFAIPEADVEDASAILSQLAATR